MSARKKDILFLLNFLLPIFIGSFIYIVFRKNTLLVFTWISFFDLGGFVNVLRSFFGEYKKYIPDFILYSLPDGLWVYSGTVLFLRIWRHEKNSFSKYFWILLPFAVSILMEFSQLFNLIRGTFCFNDVLFIIFLFIIPIYISLNKNGGSNEIA
jgi:hypothetical protein